MAVLALGFGALGCQRTDTQIGKWTAPSEAIVEKPRSPALDASVGSAEDSGTGPTASGPSMPSGPPALYFEAESAAASAPFVTLGPDIDAGAPERFIVATEASKSGAEPGDGRVSYEFSLGVAGQYVLWGRVHAPDAQHNRVWIRVDQGPWILWRIATGEAWHWDDVHENKNYGRPELFELSAGIHTLELANAASGMEIDRFYITSLGDAPPGNTTPCRPPHSIEQNGVCVPSCGSHGSTSCMTAECAGKPNIEGVYDCRVCCLLE